MVVNIDMEPFIFIMGNNEYLDIMKSLATSV